MGRNEENATGTGELDKKLTMKNCSNEINYISLHLN
jgi:hypothetical protein